MIMCAKAAEWRQSQMGAIAAQALMRKGHVGPGAAIGGRRARFFRVDVTLYGELRAGVPGSERQDFSGPSCPALLPVTT